MSTGVILAGGRSRRFGETDKTVADLAGVPMIRRVADRIAPAVERLVVNCREKQAAAIEETLAGFELPVAFAIDETPDLGPTGGIATGLREVDSEYAFVVACDMPFVDPAIAEHLFERGRGHDAAVPRLEDRWFQTTQAVYRVDPTIDACERVLADGKRKVIEVLSELEYVVVDEPEIRTVADPKTFENVNTPEELAAAAEQLSR